MSEASAVRQRRVREAYPSSLLLAAALVLVAFVLPAVVSAHAALVRSDPASNASLSQSPKQITLTFTETLEASLSSLQVLSSAGENFVEGSLALSDDSLALSIGMRELPPDVYSVVWTSYSTVDGHSLTGAFPFTVLNADGTTPTGSAFATADSGSYFRTICWSRRRRWRRATRSPHSTGANSPGFPA